MWDEAHGGGDEARAVAAAVSDVGEVAEEQGGRSEDDATPLPAHRGATEEAHGVVRRQEEDLLDELVHESLRHAGFGLGDWAGQRSEAKLRTNCDSDGWISVGRRCRQGQPNL